MFLVVYIKKKTTQECWFENLEFGFFVLIMATKKIQKKKNRMERPPWKCLSLAITWRSRNNYWAGIRFDWEKGWMNSYGYFRRLSLNWLLSLQFSFLIVWMILIRKMVWLQKNWVIIIGSSIRKKEWSDARKKWWRIRNKPNKTMNNIPALLASVRPLLEQQQ